MDVCSLLLLCAATMMTAGVVGLSKHDIPHSRQKRILWITNDGRLAFPPGTSLVIAPSLSMPFIRYPPEGFFSNITVSLPFTIDFDKLGLTDNENPYGDLSPLFSKSFGRAAGGVLGSYISKYLDRRRGKRSSEDIPPHLEKQFLDRFHGGERAILYGAVEDFLSNLGMAGKPCLLRAICEIHAFPLKKFGLIGEFLKLFFTASKSPYSDLLEEYVKAEKDGSGDTEGPGECWPYYKDCPKSLFLPSQNKYSENVASEHYVENEMLKENEINKFNNINYQPM